MNTSDKTYTNSSLSTARACLTKYDLAYNKRLRSDEDDATALAVGTCWHLAHDVAAKAGDPFQAITETAPNEVWAEKLRRLFAAYNWYWAEQEFTVTKAESTFDVFLTGIHMRGQLDAEIECDGRKGILERKTTSMDISDDAMYWDKLALDTQVGTYAMAVDFDPSFILYDVVRKPTINPKRIVKKDAARFRDELMARVSATYCGEEFTEEEVLASEEDGRETLRMYGARLTKDIGERPEHYFQRREVARTSADYLALQANIVKQVEMIEYAEHSDSMFRNPDSCNMFGRCEFFGLCTANIKPTNGTAPDGFHVREHRHPELA